MGESSSGQTVVARNRTQLDCKLNMQQLAEAFNSLSPKDYMERAIGIMGEEM
jgi:hypothetical protein